MSTVISCGDCQPKLGPNCNQDSSTDIDQCQLYIAFLHKLDDRLATADKMEVEPAQWNGANNLQELIFPMAGEEGYAQTKMTRSSSLPSATEGVFYCLFKHFGDGFAELKVGQAVHGWTDEAARPRQSRDPFRKS